ncbi:MAG: non-canonical purine NTP pyrophosphatase [Planctomycetia bacterium]|nr:non-canonical purine NTP pyrophosphatase [Planctomycetia bacterium]
MTPVLVFGTGNRHKALEMNELVAPIGIKLLTLADIADAIDVEEDGTTFAANAIKKASVQALHLHQWVLAEDSGLSVAALGGAPGVWSARFSAPDPTDEKNNDLLLAKLAGRPAEDRVAWYTCHMVLADPNGVVQVESEGRCYGRILTERHGQNGFGYDPLFEIVEYHKSFGELAPAVKRVISHRARAARAMLPALYKLSKHMTRIS